MAYTWTTGEVITAEKLNATGGGASYDLVLTETFVENGDPTMTGTGLSFEELMQKIDNGEDISVKYTLNKEKTKITTSYFYVKFLLPLDIVFNTRYYI